MKLWCGKYNNKKFYNNFISVFTLYGNKKITILLFKTKERKIQTLHLHTKEKNVKQNLIQG